MSIPALLLFIFAPVLGLLFAPLLSALVRVRAVAVLSALIVAASLSVSAPAEAEEWRGFCKMDEWDDTSKCRATARDAVAGAPLSESVFLVYQCLTGDDGKIRESVFLGKGSRGVVDFVGNAWMQFRFSGIEREHLGDSYGTDVRVGPWLHKVLVRWDKEPASEAVFFKPDRWQMWNWIWGKPSSDWRGWKGLEMTPTYFPNPIRLLQEKSQLRIRVKLGDNPKVFNFSLAGARESIAEAKRGCGL